MEASTMARRSGSRRESRRRNFLSEASYGRRVAAPQRRITTLQPIGRPRPYVQAEHRRFGRVPQIAPSVISSGQILGGPISAGTGRYQRPEEPAFLTPNNRTTLPDNRLSSHMTRNTMCNRRPDSRSARRGNGGSKRFVPWC
ncbi:hypothetical protein [Tortoise microvirus 79]|nr:hypothetical protein [Tortoise microvirus 79]